MLVTSWEENIWRRSIDRHRSLRRRSRSRSSCRNTTGSVRQRDPTLHTRATGVLRVSATTVPGASEYYCEAANKRSGKINYEGACMYWNAHAGLSSLWLNSLAATFSRATNVDGAVSAQCFEKRRERQKKGIVLISSSRVVCSDKKNEADAPTDCTVYRLLLLYCV